MQMFKGSVGRFVWNRWASGLAIASSLACGAAATSCGGGGGGGGAAKPMVLVEFLFVDRALKPSFPTGVKELPRNAEIVFQFSELVDPNTVDDQTIAIRFGPQFQSIPKGSFQVDNDRVIFDPTISQQGTPNPFGLQPGTQYNVELPSVADASTIHGASTPVVHNLDNDPLLNSFFSNFTTSDKYLRELVPPQVLSVAFIPTPDPLTKQIPGNGVMTIKFSEAMDPGSFVLATGPVPTISDTVDVRYSDLSPNPNINTDGAPAVPTPTGVYGSELKPIPGSFSYDPTATTYIFAPTFSFGDKKYVFSVALFQGLKDLAGNLLINPRSFGPYTVDGTGRSTGRTLVESFDVTTDEDGVNTTADWGSTIAGQLQGAAITTRRAYIAGYQLANALQAGQYNPVIDPLVGEQINNYIVNLTPPSTQGRRVMWAFEDLELGQAGTVTTASWGPDSNATFAAQYPDVILRIGFQKTSSMSLATTFSGNYLGSPLIVYKGPYSVSQKANVGDQYTQPTNTSGLFAGDGCPYPPPNGDIDCLYRYRGYVDWPTLTSYFDWDPGDPTVADDSIMVFDASVQDGDTFQQLRAWYGVTHPNSGILLAGYPTRRMLATYEEDVPNPASNFTAGIVNPEPSLTDTAFTITKRVSFAQTRFYTPDPVDPAGNTYAGPYSGSTTFGTKSDYLAPVITPAVQSGGAQILIEFQGATLLDPTSSRTKVNLASPSTNFTTNINDCDTFPYLRWRLTLTSNLNFNTVAKVGSVIIPIIKLP